MQTRSAFDHIVQRADKLASFLHDEGPGAARLVRSASRLVGASTAAPGPGKSVGVFAVGALVGAAAGLALALGPGSDLRARALKALRAAAHGRPFAQGLVNTLMGAAPHASEASRPTAVGGRVLPRVVGEETWGQRDANIW